MEADGVYLENGRAMPNKVKGQMAEVAVTTKKHRVLREVYLIG